MNNSFYQNLYNDADSEVRFYKKQINELSDYILKEFPKEIKCEGAILTAIEILKKYKEKLNES